MKSEERSCLRGVWKETIRARNGPGSMSCTPFRGVSITIRSGPQRPPGKGLRAGPQNAREEPTDAPRAACRAASVAFLQHGEDVAGRVGEPGDVRSAAGGAPACDPPLVLPEAVVDGHGHPARREG